MTKKENKSEIVRKFGKEPNDTGSAGVQIALLSGRIQHLSGHLKTAKKDHASRLGLLKMVGSRRRLLTYLKKNDPASYTDVSKRLEIRK